MLHFISLKMMHCLLVIIETLSRYISHCTLESMQGAQQSFVVPSFTSIGCIRLNGKGSIETKMVVA
jgi:hypothetical protein